MKEDSIGHYKNTIDYQMNSFGIIGMIGGTLQQWQPNRMPLLFGRKYFEIRGDEMRGSSTTNAQNPSMTLFIVWLPKRISLARN